MVKALRNYVSPTMPLVAAFPSSRAVNLYCFKELRETEEQHRFLSTLTRRSRQFHDAAPSAASIPLPPPPTTAPLILRRTITSNQSHQCARSPQWQHTHPLAQPARRTKRHFTPSPRRTKPPRKQHTQRRRKRCNTRIDPSKRSRQQFLRRRRSKRARYFHTRGYGEFPRFTAWHVDFD